MKSTHSTVAPRVLVVNGGRINTADTANNGLLLRNLFATWPRESLAQIFSSGDNGDAGFFGHYYQMGYRDRCFGKLFYYLKFYGKGRHLTNSGAYSTGSSVRETTGRSLSGRFFLDTGIYELLFRPHFSHGMLDWVRDFQPDVIFAQGYNLTFTWLPIMLAHRFRLPLVYYPTDDWVASYPTVSTNWVPVLSWLAHRIAAAAAHELVDRATVRLAFNRYMQKEYNHRYAKEFSVLMHGDDATRYARALPRRLVSDGVYSIVSTGYFDHHRWPLVCDLEYACAQLAAKGLHVRAFVYLVNETNEVRSWAKGFRYVTLMPCPLHEDLVAVLRGADILFLPERFDDTVKSIGCSISTKAHLFMFSGRPIIVYASPETGVARYAKEERWAAVVEREDPCLLAETIERLLTDSGACRNLILAAGDCALRNHDISEIRTRFRALLDEAI